MKKSFEGLSVVIDELFPGQLFSGAFFIFLNRYRDQMKVLCWDGDGFVIFHKRLEKGTFYWKWKDIEFFNRRDFFMLLEGITPKQLQPRFSV